MNKMQEVNLLRNYPKTSRDRATTAKKRGITHKLVASQRSYEYFDGDRVYGYGGLKQDNRWDQVAKDICFELDLDSNSSILQVNCEKGFLLNSLYLRTHSKKLYGTESSKYAVQNTYSKDNYTIIENSLPVLPFANDSIDLVISLGNIYTLGLLDAYHHLREIERIKSRFSFITLATYSDKEDFWLFKNWSLLANLILSRNEWIDLMNEARYTGYYFFIDANYLGLRPD